jgi:hypothetical protein
MFMPRDFRPDAIRAAADAIEASGVPASPAAVRLRLRLPEDREPIVRRVLEARRIDAMRRPAAIPPLVAESAAVLARTIRACARLYGREQCQPASAIASAMAARVAAALPAAVTA